MSTSSSSSVSSRSETRLCAVSPSLSLSPGGIPVISIGHISEDTDFESLAAQLDQCAARGIYQMASISKCDVDRPAVKSGAAMTINMCQRTPAEGYAIPKLSLNQYLQNLDILEDKLKLGGSISPTSPLAYSEDFNSAHSTSTWESVHYEGSRPAIVDEVAVLVDTDRGRQRRSSKPRPTLAQTLSRLAEPSKNVQRKQILNRVSSHCINKDAQRARVDDEICIVTTDSQEKPEYPKWDQELDSKTRLVAIAQESLPRVGARPSAKSTEQRETFDLPPPSSGALSNRDLSRMHSSKGIGPDTARTTCARVRFADGL